MRLEDLLWQKAGEYTLGQIGWCEKMLEYKVPKGELGVFLKNCDEYKREEEEEPCRNCRHLRCAHTFVEGAKWMMHRCKPLILEKVVEDLVGEESPYYDSPAFFDVE